MKEMKMVVMAIVFAILASFGAALCIAGCGGTPETPPCGPGTYEFRGICLPNETEPPCGPGTYRIGDVCVAEGKDRCGAGTHWDPEVCEGYDPCGKCIADPVTPPPPPAKTIVCDENTTKESNGKCVALTMIEQDKDCLARGGPQMPCFHDGDKDGYGGKFAAVHCSGLCEAFGLVDKDSDCNDKDAAIHPNAMEVCDGVDNNCDDKVDEGCVPPATITFSKVQYATDPWQVMLGWGGVIIGEFEVKGDPNEDVLITELTVADKTQNPLDANSFKNLTLVNVSAVNQIAMTPAFNTKANSAYALAKFTSFKLLVPKGQTLRFNVNANVASYDDGGALYTEHRFAILEDVDLAPGIQPPATAVSAKTGLPAKIIANAEGRSLELVATKPSVSFAADSPSGSGSMASNMVMTKLVITNPSNVGNYLLKIHELLPVLVVNGLTLEKGGVVSVYSGSTLLGSATLPKDVAGKYNAFVPLNNALQISSGSSVTIAVQFTGNVTYGQSPTLRLDLPKNGLTWQWTGGKYYYATDNLPLIGKPLTF